MAETWGVPPWTLQQEEYNAGCFYVWRERFALLENARSEKQRIQMDNLTYG